MNKIILFSTMVIILSSCAGNFSRTDQKSATRNAASTQKFVLVQKKQIMKPIAQIDTGTLKAEVLSSCRSSGGYSNSSYVLCGTETGVISFCSVACFPSEAQLTEFQKPTPINSYCPYNCEDKICNNEEFLQDAKMAESLKVKARCMSEPSNRFSLPPGQLIEDSTVCNVQKTATGIVVSCDGICVR